MTSTFHLYYTVVVNPESVNRKTFQVEKLNISNITSGVSQECLKADTRKYIVLRFFNIFSFN